MEGVLRHGRPVRHRLYNEPFHQLARLRAGITRGERGRAHRHYRRVIPFCDHRVHGSSQFIERRVSLRADKTVDRYDSGFASASSAVKKFRLCALNIRRYHMKIISAILMTVILMFTLELPSSA